MEDKKKISREARERASRTGESYVVARMHVTSDGSLERRLAAADVTLRNLTVAVDRTELARKREAAKQESLRLTAELGRDPAFREKVAKVLSPHVVRFHDDNDRLSESPFVGFDVTISGHVDSREEYVRRGKEVVARLKEAFPDMSERLYACVASNWQNRRMTCGLPGDLLWRLDAIV